MCSCFCSAVVYPEWFLIALIEEDCVDDNFGSSSWLGRTLQQLDASLLQWRLCNPTLHSCMICVYTSARTGLLLLVWC